MGFKLGRKGSEHMTIRDNEILHKKWSYQWTVGPDGIKELLERNELEREER